MEAVTFAGDCEGCPSVSEQVTDQQLYENVICTSRPILFPRHRNAAGRESLFLSIREPRGSPSSFPTSGWAQPLGGAGEVPAGW